MQPIRHRDNSIIHSVENWGIHSGQVLNRRAWQEEAIEIAQREAMIRRAGLVGAPGSQFSFVRRWLGSAGRILVRIGQSLESAGTPSRETAT